MKLSSKVLAIAAIVGSSVVYLPTANAGVIQLGFILDRSGSIGASNWTTIVNGSTS